MVDSVTVRYPGPVAEISQITTPLPPRFTVGVRCFFADVLCLCGIVHYSQMSPLWPCLSRGH